MSDKVYSHFVRPATVETRDLNTPLLNGEEARKLYLEEVGYIQNHKIEYKNKCTKTDPKLINKIDQIELSNQQLFYSVQNNEIDKIKQALDTYPDKINTVDEFGWSLLMIACQANSIEAVKLLLDRGIDSSTRDKAGNSAQSLIIRNKNYILADILLQHTRKTKQKNMCMKKTRHKDERFKKQFKCKICDNNVFDNKQEHLSSTIHNLNASKGKEIPINYIIPESNKGYQLMLKDGWQKKGLGPHGAGNKYPIKVHLKNDQTGLGYKKNKVLKTNKESPKQINKKISAEHCEKNRQLEIHFRREFY